MEKPVLCDASLSPQDTLRTTLPAPALRAWDEVQQVLTEKYPLFSQEWRFYKDGGSWLLKVTKKKKTICWISVFSTHFKIGFYFPVRTEEELLASALSPALKKQFKEGKAYGKTKGLTLTVNTIEDLEELSACITLRERI